MRQEPDFCGVHSFESSRGPGSAVELFFEITGYLNTVQGPACNEALQREIKTCAELFQIPNSILDCFTCAYTKFADGTSKTLWWIVHARLHYMLCYTLYDAGDARSIRAQAMEGDYFFVLFLSVPCPRLHLITNDR
jgi:hypothetical protein